MKKIVLVDGNNLLFRSFYATGYSGVIMRNSKGFPTNALYGFINMMNKIIHDEKPEYILVALDKGKTFRHEKYQEYKGKRDETPIELKQQFPVAKEVMDALGIPYLEVENYEADDIIGTVSKWVNHEDDFNALIVSSDKDLLQLITDKVHVKHLKQSGHVYMDEAAFREVYHVAPIRMIDLKALMGDSSDNIPGVKGIGEKTAIKLIEEYESLDNLYNHLDELSGAVKTKLETDKRCAYASFDLATICQNIPLDKTFEDFRYKGMNITSYIEILKRLEFNSMLKKLDMPLFENIQEEPRKSERELIILDSLDGFEIEEACSIMTEVVGSNYHYDEICGFSVTVKDKTYFIDKDLIKKNPHIFENDVEKYAYDLKKLKVVLKRLGAGIKGCNFDLSIAGYLLNYNVKEDIAYLARSKNYDIEFYDVTFGRRAKLKMPDRETLISDLRKKSEFIYDIKSMFIQELENNDQMYLFKEIEMPLLFVLEDMESTGIKVNQSFLEGFGEDLKREFEQIEQEIYNLAGVEFNISSPKQLGAVLFDGLKIPYPKKIKDNNYSTSKEILDHLIEYPIVEKVLRYRTLTKIYNTYCIGLISEIHNGRIHTIFNQTLTKTGRLSSDTPNLQNIPIRLEEGKQVRKAFIPDEDSILLSSDYSQIELRVFASFANATSMIDAFKNGHDIHARTASEIFRVPLDEVTKDMRRCAKAVNFGIIYGISSFGLSEDLNIDVRDAKTFIDNYLNAYPGIKKFMNDTIKDAYDKGYVKTIMGRKRTIEELKNKNFMVRSQGERMALNTPVQGSAADILKKAMIEIYDEFRRRNLKSKMLIQVHDELVFNVKLDELEIVQEIVKNKMENVYTFEVPLKVDIETGTNWYEAK